MDEINGLANIVGSAETLHGIEAPPEPEDLRTDAEYCKALDAYYDRVSPFWHAQRVEPTR